MPKKKEKVVKAWAVVTKRGKIFQALTFTGVVRYSDFFSFMIYSTKKEAQASALWEGLVVYKIIPIKISYGE